MMSKFCFVFLSFFLSSILNAQSTLNFVEHIIQNNFGGACTIASEDLDGDGDCDVIATSFNDNYISWFENDGNQNFTEHRIVENFGEATVVDVAHIDGDDDFDLVATAQADNKISWFENDGSGNFIEHIITTNYQSAGFVYARDQQRGIDLDINGDGYTDFIATATEPGDKISWFENDGNQNFTEHLLKENWFWVRRASAYDIDQDGDIDIFAGGKAGDLIWFENDGNQKFSENTIISDWGWLNAVLAEDINKDGFIDLVATTVQVNEVAWFENDGNQNFTKHVIADNYEGAFGMVISDIDEDNDWDILSTAWIGGFGSIFENDGNQNFSEYVFCDTGNELLHLFTIDLDKDSDLDILGACYDESLPELRWWENYKIHLYAGIGSDNHTGHIPLNVNFFDNSSSSQEIETWEWDLNGDGNPDSYDRNPQWTYSQTGFYDVSLKVTSQLGENILRLKNYIHTFNGESSLRFIQSADYTETISNAKLNITENFSIELCINPESIPNNLDGLTVLDKDKLKIYVPGKGFGTIKKNGIVLEYVNTEGKEIRACTDENIITPGLWQQITVSANFNTHLINIFINGKQLNVNYIGTSSFDLPIEDNLQSSLILGNNYDKTLPFNGCIDELRIWDYAKTEEEILENLNKPPDLNADGLVLYYNMNEGNGDTLTDLSSSGNDAVIYNSQFWEGVELEKLTEVRSCPKESLVLKDFLLSQNYPNPFNPNTTIKFGIPDRCDVKIKIYNSLGEEIEKLIDRNMERGFYEIVWNAGHQTSGIYLLSFIAKSNNSNMEFTQTKKLVLIK